MKPVGQLNNPKLTNVLNDPKILNILNGIKTNLELVDFSPFELNLMRFISTLLFPVS